MVKSIKAIIIAMVVVSMTTILLSSCGQNNPLSAPHPSGGGITPGAPNAYTSGGPKPIRLPAWIEALPPASVSCLLKQPNLNLNATSPNIKPFNQLCGNYVISYIWGRDAIATGMDSSSCPGGSIRVYQCLYKNITINGRYIMPKVITYDYQESLCDGKTILKKIPPPPAGSSYRIPCDDPCLMGGSFPEDAFTGNGAPPTRYLAGDGTIYDNMGSPPIPPASGPPKLIWVGITPDNASISVGQAGSFAATGVYNPPPTESDVTANIKSSNPAVATVVNGLVTGISEGHVDLTVSLDGVMAWSYVDVVLGAPDSVVIEPASATMLIGDKYTFKAFAVYPGNKRVDVSSRYETTWSSGDTAVATIAGGVATAVASGSTPVSTTFKGMTGTATVNVIDIPPVPDQVIITPLNASISQGETQQFIATAIYPNRSIDITTDVNTIWTVGDTSKATIDSSGLVKGIAVGQSYVWFMYKGLQPNPAAKLDIALPKLRLSMSYIPTNPKVGDYVTLTTYLDSSDINVPTVNVSDSWNTKYTTDNPPMIHNITGIFSPPQITSSFWIDTDGTANIYATHQTADGRIASGSTIITVGQKKTNACGIVYPRLYQYTGWDVNPPTDSAWARYPYANYTAIGPGSTFWGNMEMFDGSVGYLGCNLTCYSMILSTIDPTLTPGKLNRVLKQKGWYDGGNGPMPIALRKLSNNQIKEAYNTTYDNAIWKAELDKCNVIIAHRTGSQPSGHYVLVIGYNNKGEFIAYDPARDPIQALTVDKLIMDDGHIMVKFN